MNDPLLTSTPTDLRPPTATTPFDFGIGQMPCDNAVSCPTSSGRGVESHSDGDWQFLRSKESFQAGAASDASGQGRRPPSVEDCAWLTPCLPGQVKWALSSRDGLRLQAELPRSGFSNLHAMHRMALRGFEYGTRLTAKAARQAVEPEGERGAAEWLDADGLLSLCEEAGWPATARGDGSFNVDLEVPHQPHAARLTISSHAIWLCAEIAALEAYAPVCRRALAFWLLRANARLCWARGGFFDRDDIARAGFEIRLAVRPEAGGLGLALSALAVACETCGRQAGALADESVGRLFLETGVGPAY